MHVEVVDVAGVVVAIHNVPGEGDVGVVLTDYLEVADMMVLGSCISSVKERYGKSAQCLGCLLVTITIWVPVSDPENSTAIVKRIIIFRELSSHESQCTDPLAKVDSRPSAK